MLNFCLYKPCAMCLSLLHFQPCAGSEPDCNCCLSNKYTYMQLRSPEVTRVNFHLSYLGARDRDSNNLNGSPRWANLQDLNHTEEYETVFLKTSNLNWKEARACQRGEPRVKEKNWTVGCGLRAVCEYIVCLLKMNATIWFLFVLVCIYLSSSGVETNFLPVCRGVKRGTRAPSEERRVGA